MIENASIVFEFENGYEEMLNGKFERPPNFIHVKKLICINI